MKVVLNGTRHELSAGATVDDAVESIGASEPRNGLAVAVDGEVVPRAEWGTHELGDAAHVEVLTAMQGG
jgi:sulfur carrier protein